MKIILYIESRKACNAKVLDAFVFVCITTMKITENKIYLNFSIQFYQKQTHIAIAEKYLIHLLVVYYNCNTAIVYIGARYLNFILYSIHV